MTDPNGNVTEYEYNRRSEFLTAVSNPDETLGNPRTELSYIAGRKLSQISNADVSYSFTYNSYETTESVELGGTLFLATNQYDESGKLDTVTYANGDTHKVIYDDKTESPKMSITAQHHSNIIIMRTEISVSSLTMIMISSGSISMTLRAD